MPLINTEPKLKPQAGGFRSNMTIASSGLASTTFRRSCRNALNSGAFGPPKSSPFFQCLDLGEHLGIGLARVRVSGSLDIPRRVLDVRDLRLQRRDLLL